ncbi:MAG: alpha/beta fold hydrolase [Betaproteobacteria bacterium]
MSRVPALPELRLVAIDPERAGMEGARMSYMEAGTGHHGTVLLLHGIGSNCTGWRYVLDGLGASFRTIAWNAPGYYLSDFLRDAAPTNWQYADALAALMEALGIASAHVAGSSFGSLVAASFAARHPQRVRRLVLLGASRGQKWLPAEERARSLALRDESARAGAIAMSEQRWRVLLGPQASEVAVRLTREVLMATHPRGLMQSARATDATDVCEFAGSIRASTLLATGSEDKVNPPEIARTIAAAIPGSRFTELAGIGHLPKLEDPARTIALLKHHFMEER